MLLVCAINCYTYHHIVHTSNQQQSQEYSPLLAIQEEGASGVQEKVFEAPNLFELPEKSELVTFSSCSFHTAYCVEDQHETSEYQHFSKILAAKGIAVETIVELIHTSATCVPIFEYHITELLYLIDTIIENAGPVFLAENICKRLPAVVEQALIMMVCAYVCLHTNVDRHLQNITLSFMCS